MKRGILTPTHLYVERMDGSSGRLPRQRIRACRRMDHRLLFGVEDGEDLIVMHRARDSLEDELIALAGGNGVAWSNVTNQTQAVWVGAIGTCFAVALSNEYSIAEARDRWADGMFTAEVCLGVYAAVFALLVALFAIAWIPSRIRIDRLGVERTRGVLGLFTFHVPADRVELVVSQHATPGYETMLIFDVKVYLGTLRPTRSMLAAKFRGVAARNLALRLSEQLRVLLDARHRNLTH